MNPNNIVEAALNALTLEATLSPKPGLVDPQDVGAHDDMDYSLFLKSIHALSVWFPQYIHLGLSHQGTPATLFEAVRQVGIDAETEMLRATSGVNTHKGANFLFGVTLSAIGYGNYPPLNDLIHLIQSMTQGLVSNELTTITTAQSYGEKMFKEHGVSGIRGEVESGFPTVLAYGLPLLSHLDVPTEYHYKLVLLHLIKWNTDTNMLKRGGAIGLALGQRLAGASFQDLDEHLDMMNTEFKKYNLSPGGSADLLALTIFLDAYTRIECEKGSI